MVSSVCTMRWASSSSTRWLLSILAPAAGFAAFVSSEAAGRHDSARRHVLAERASARRTCELQLRGLKRGQLLFPVRDQPLQLFRSEVISALPALPLACRTLVGTMHLDCISLSRSSTFSSMRLIYGEPNGESRAARPPAL